MDCTSAQYAGQGCIGTAVSTGGGLPMTGLDIVTVVILGVVIALSGLWLRHTRA